MTESNEERKPISSLRLLVISFTMYLLAIFIGIFGATFGIPLDNRWSIIFGSIIIALSLNVVGVLKGFQERKTPYESTIDGIIGNLIPILLFLILLGVFLSYLSAFSGWRA